MTMSHILNPNQLLLSLQLLIMSLDEIMLQARQLERQLREMGTSSEEEQKEEEESGRVPHFSVGVVAIATTETVSAFIPCRACGSPVRQTASIRLLDPNGDDHADTCSLGRVCRTGAEEFKTGRSRPRAEP